MSILLLLLIPAFIAAFAYLKNKQEITTGEFLIQMFMQSILIFGIYTGVRHMQLQDTEIWNGRVTEKKREEVHCRHSYSCNCVTVRCGKSCSTTVCQTCYDHAFDVDWNIFNNIGEDWSIDTTDRQGLEEPAFWTAAKPGDPTSSKHDYTNYIKNSHVSLFNKGTATVAYPGYPDAIYGYYNLNRVVDVDGILPDKAAWEADVSSVSADLGRVNQANIIIYMVKNKPLEYFDGLNRAWSGAKENDIVVVMNVDGSSFTWVNTIALVKDEYFRVKLRDDILKIGRIDRAKIMQAIREDVTKHYVRRPMADFKYLLNATKLSTGWFIVAFVLSIGISIGLAFIFANNEWRNDEGNSYRSRGGAWVRNRYRGW